MFGFLGAFLFAAIAVQDPHFIEVGEEPPPVHTCRVGLENLGDHFSIGVDFGGDPELLRAYSREFQRAREGQTTLDIVVNGFSWIGLLGIEVREFKTPDSPNLHARILVVPHSNHPDMKFTSVELAPGEAKEFEFSVSRVFSENVLEAFHKLTQAFANFAQAKNVQFAFEIAYHNVFFEDFNQIRRPLFEHELLEDSEPTGKATEFIEEWSEEKIIEQLFDNDIAARDRFLAKVSIDSMRVFYEIDLQGRKNFYLLLYNDLAHYAFQYRIQVRNP